MESKISHKKCFRDSGCWFELDSSASSATGSSGSIMGDRCNVLYSSDSETGARKHSNSGLCTRTGSSCLVPARSSDSNVQGCYSPILGNSCSCCCSLHRSIRRTLEAIGFHVLSSGTTGYSLCAAQISNMDQSIVERRVDVCDTPALDSFLLRHSSGPRRIFEGGQHAFRYI